ncbi:MAG: hypothetical protein WA754_25440 [Pseudolabrys sp.]
MTLPAARQHRRRDANERLGRLEVDDQLELGRLLDRDVTRFRAAQNFVDILGCAAEQVRNARPVRHETSRIDVFPQAVHRRQSCAQRQDIDANAVGVGERVGAHVQRLRPGLEPLEGRRDIVGAVDFEPVDLEPKPAGHSLNLTISSTDAA